MKSSEKAKKTFADFYCNPFQDLTEEDSKFQDIQRFVVLMYWRTSTLSSVNEARMELYFQRSTHDVESIPPTSNALLYHTKRAIYQCGVWSKCLQSLQKFSSQGNFGWKEISDPIVKWEPLWMTKVQAIKEMREFIKCNCKQPCNKCKCKDAQLNFTLLCSCSCEKKDSYN